MALINSKFNRGLVDRLCEALRAGNHIDTSCELVGLHKSSYYLWMKKARLENPKPEYVHFLEQVEKAHADAEAEMVALIRVAAREPRNWQAASWWLERSKPKKWGRRAEIVEQVEDNQDFEIDLSPVGPELAVVGFDGDGE